ncbi:glutamine--fructose-6-phosphate transaminase (isomerizing) [soil metagenome]
MCGIVGYVGPGNAKDVILKGLSRLEYRGYDSAGIAVANNGVVKVEKCAGKVADLSLRLDETFNQTSGIGHTRWATHGEPSNRNAHPHLTPSGKIAIVHNGIIENYTQIKQELTKQGYTFKSDTDTEVLAILIEAIKTNTNVPTDEAIRLALHEVVGAYALVVIDADEPDTIFVAKKGGPLVIGIGKNNAEYLVGSDATPIVEYTREVVYLKDGEMAILKPGKKLTILHTKDASKHRPYVDHLELNIEAIEKAGYDHFMLKEIFEQPRAIKDSLRGRIKAREGIVRLGGIEEFEPRLSTKTKKITIIACGTSYHAAMMGKYWIEKLARIPVEVDMASEFRYRNPIMGENDVVFFISQSGETADTLAAIELVRERGALCLGIVNVAGSSIARATGAGIYTHAGPEMSVASTKAFSTQMCVLFALALRLAVLKGTIGDVEYRSLLSEFAVLPDALDKYLNNGASKDVDAVAATIAKARDVIFLGRGESYPVALEGALKLKEITYIHADGYAAGEMKHGPIALIDKKVPVIVIAPEDELQEKTLSNMQEMKARKAIVIAVINSPNEQVSKHADHVMVVPKTSALLTPFMTVVPLQLLAYKVALLRGCDVDKPRNLAKSVTVE